MGWRRGGRRGGLWMWLNWDIYDTPLFVNSTNARVGPTVGRELPSHQPFGSPRSRARRPTYLAGGSHEVQPITRQARADTSLMPPAAAIPQNRSPKPPRPR